MRKILIFTLLTTVMLCPASVFCNFSLQPDYSIDASEIEDTSVTVLNTEPDDTFPSPGDVFTYVTPDGSTYQFSINRDYCSVTLLKGNANNISTLEIPSYVEYKGLTFYVSQIGAFAFNSHSIKTVDNGPLSGVSTLILPRTLEYVGQNCFTNALDLKLVILPASLRNISYSMFYGCKSLQNIIIQSESELEEIESFAFADCVSLEAFKIPGNVTSIKQGPWRNCKSLEKLDIDEDNYRYNIIDGVLYSNTGQRLIQYPAGKRDLEYSLLASTQSIDNSAFYGNDYIEKVSFPGVLDSISHIAFKECANLSEVIFTDSISFIGNSAFGDCPKLKTIQLYGDPAFTKDSGSRYNTFMPEVEIKIDPTAPKRELVKSGKGILNDAWLTVSQLPGMAIIEDIDVEDYGFPKNLGNAKFTGFGNSYPKKDVVKILDLIPEKFKVYEYMRDNDHIRRCYADFKNRQLLIFVAGRGGNDLVLWQFYNCDKNEMKKFIESLE